MTGDSEQIIRGKHSKRLSTFWRNLLLGRPSEVQVCNACNCSEWKHRCCWDCNYLDACLVEWDKMEEGFRANIYCPWSKEEDHEKWCSQILFFMRRKGLVPKVK